MKLQVVTNRSKENITRANTVFEPGKNEFPENHFTLGDVVQIDKHPALSVSTANAKKQAAGEK